MFVDDAGGHEALALTASIAGVTAGRLTAAGGHPPGRGASGIEALTTPANAETLLGGLPAELLAWESRGAGRGPSVPASRIGLGGTAGHLLHAAHQSVMPTPAGHVPAGRPRRITVGYVRRPQCDEAVTRAAVRPGVPLRLVTPAVDRADLGALGDDLAVAIRLAGETPGMDAGAVEAEICEGDDVADAIADIGGLDGELFVCASGEDAPVHRVFLGETAFKVVRAVPGRGPPPRPDVEPQLSWLRITPTDRP